MENKVETPSAIDNKELEQAKQPPEPTVKRSPKEEKGRKKDDKSVEQVLKALNSLETTEEKLAAMCKKYTDIVDENRKLQLTVKQSEKRLSIVQREKEQLQTEHSKAVLTRSRLESLCRELQRQNKVIKDESLLKIREEEEKRKEVSAKFQSTLNEITALMQQNNEKNAKLRDDNIEMAKKFKTVCEQYELREQQVEKITKQKQLEAQLADAKLAKAKMEMAAEKEALLKEKQQLLMDLTEYQAKCQELQTTEVNLRSQISLYTDKYDEFQNALSRSNEVFGGFKGEMEKMCKKICKLEKETSSWKQRWEKSHQALLEMAADKQQRDGELALATRQLAQLQKLCRTLQAERTSLLAQLRTESAGKEGGPVTKDVPLEPMQPSQHSLPCPLKAAGNQETCRHEPQKDSTSTQTPVENCETVSNLINQNIDVQLTTASEKTAENAAVETTNNLITKEDISPEVPPVEESGIIDASQENKSSIAITSQESVQPQGAMSPEANLPKNDNDPCPLIQDLCANAVETKCPTIEAKSDINSNPTPANEEIGVEAALINGMVETKNALEMESGDNKDVNVPGSEMNHVAVNGVEQELIKSPPADNKKAKEGAKKRKNK